MPIRMLRKLVLRSRYVLIESRMRKVPESSGVSHTHPGGALIGMAVGSAVWSSTG